MIDIHNHVIFEFDDGPTSLDESLEMLKIAAGQGITDVFATSHFNEVLNPELETAYFSKLEILRKELPEKSINIRLHSGSELFFHHYMHHTVKSSKVGTLAGQDQYILMEFPLYLMPSGVEETLFSLTMDGYIPIIAHPERYSALHEKSEKILTFVQHGGLLQVNVGSVLGRFGRTVKKISMWLLENHYVHFLASDAHSPRGRTFQLAEAAAELEKYLDKSYIQQLVKANPQKIIDKDIMDPVFLPEVVPAESFLQRFKKKLKSI